MKGFIPNQEVGIFLTAKIIGMSRWCVPHFVDSGPKIVEARPQKKQMVCVMAVHEIRFVDYSRDGITDSMGYFQVLLRKKDKDVLRIGSMGEKKLKKVAAPY
jgi:hypothetical protein